LPASNPPPNGQLVVVIGGSRGSIGPLRQILGALPADLPAAVLVVVHLAPSQRRPIALVAGHTSLQVALAEDGVHFAAGKVYLAPSDHHLALEAGVLRVFRGPRENGSRPAIDTLFRSAAVHYGSRVVGVLLSGLLGDGSGGLAAIKRCGGTAVVQDPLDALSDEIPRRALEATTVDHCVPASQIAALLTDIAQRPAAPSPPVPEDLRVEAHLAISAAPSIQAVQALGQPVPLVCPACDGPLWQVSQLGSHHYRCHLAHSFSPEAMLSEQAVAMERALWVAFRTLKERGLLLEKMALEARERGHMSMADNYEERIRELEQHALDIHRWVAAGNELVAEEEGGRSLGA
jgi:two-component system chemotaxis response regulator CheB